MSRRLNGIAFFGVLCFFYLGSMSAGQAPSDSAIIIDHACAVLGDIPESWIELAKQTLHIAYGHTSHGSQLTTGMTGLVNWKGDLYSWNFGGTDGALDMREWDYGVGFGAPAATTWAVDLGNPDRSAWATATREYLDIHPEINVVIWSWCWQMLTDVAADIDLYLSLMNGLEGDYPSVKFVYMTGHVDAGQEWGEGTTWGHQHYMRAKQIRDYCITNKKILYDFADIESWDPEGNWYGDKLVDDACNYDSNEDGTTDRNWAIDWQDAHPGEWYDCEASHSQPLNANLKAYAAWHLWARLAGWTGPSRAINKADFNNDSQEDILWRYYGPGPYQGLVLTWLMNQSGSMSPALKAAGQTLTGEKSLIMRSIPGAGNPAGKTVISDKIATQKKGSKTLMEGRKARAQKTKLSVRSPLDAGRKARCAEPERHRYREPLDSPDPQRCGGSRIVELR